MEEEYSMGKTMKIMRRSIFVFLQNYQTFTTFAAFLAFPFAALVLLSESLVPSSSLLRVIHSRIQTLFDAAGFPRSSEFFIILNLKLSQTISTSFLVLPFALSFHLLAKAFVIQVLCSQKKSGFSFISLYNPIFHTQMCNTLLIISANSTCFSILFFIFNFMESLGLSGSKWIIFCSATGALFYSIVLANALIICSLALILSGMEKRGGYMAIIKASMVIKGRRATALSLALPMNLGLAAVEALFEYRIMRAYYYQGENPNPIPMGLEGLFIAYLYAILLVLDTVIGCLFYRSCCKSCGGVNVIVDQQESCRRRYNNTYRIEIQERNGNAYARLNQILDDDDYVYEIA